MKSAPPLGDQLVAGRRSILSPMPIGPATRFTDRGGRCGAAPASSRVEGSARFWTLRARARVRPVCRASAASINPLREIHQKRGTREQKRGKAVRITFARARLRLVQSSLSPVRNFGEIFKRSMTLKIVVRQQSSRAPTSKLPFTFDDDDAYDYDDHLDCTAFPRPPAASVRAVWHELSYKQEDDDGRELAASGRVRRHFRRHDSRGEPPHFRRADWHERARSTSCFALHKRRRRRVTVGIVICGAGGMTDTH